jgi:hypothetical protein
MAKYIVHCQERKIYRSVKNFTMEVEADDVDEARQTAEFCYHNTDVQDLWAKIEETGNTLEEIESNVFFETPRRVVSEWWVSEKP